MKNLEIRISFSDSFELDHILSLLKEKIKEDIDQGVVFERRVYENSMSYAWDFKQEKVEKDT